VSALRRRCCCCRHDRADRGVGGDITGAALDGDVTVVFCDLLIDGRQHCPGCGSEGIYRDTVVRKGHTDVPVVGHPLRLRVRVPHYRCTSTDCDREVFAHNTSRLAGPGGRPRVGVLATFCTG
jgi:transposase